MTACKHYESWQEVGSHTEEVSGGDGQMGEVHVFEPTRTIEIKTYECDECGGVFSLDPEGGEIE